MTETKSKNKGGIFSPLARLARGVYDWFFNPNVDEELKELYGGLTPKQAKRELERKVVARFSRGNVRMQYGEYVTSEDVEEARKKMQEFLKYDDFKRINRAS